MRGQEESQHVWKYSVQQERHWWAQRRGEGAFESYPCCCRGVGARRLGKVLVNVAGQSQGARVGAGCRVGYRGFEEGQGHQTHSLNPRYIEVQSTTCSDNRYNLLKNI